MAKEACNTCDLNPNTSLKKLGEDSRLASYTIALAGNPNTGKSSIFNTLTGLKQHTGNWPGKTVVRAEGAFQYQDNTYKIIDLPGTYSLLSTSEDEEVARDFVLFQKPSVTVVVVDATRLQRNLNLVLQILQITQKVVLCLNLIDEAKRNHIQIETRTLAKDLGIPVVTTSARTKEGIDELLQTIHEVATGKIKSVDKCNISFNKNTTEILQNISKKLLEKDPQIPNTQWLAIRLLEKDRSILHALENGSISTPFSQEELANLQKYIEEQKNTLDTDCATTIAEGIYEKAQQIVNDSVQTTEQHNHFRLDKKIDQIVTHQFWGFPIMLLILAIVLWLTITGANYPSEMLAYILIDQLQPLLKSGFEFLNAPWWLSGFLIDGVYLSTAWVVSVMLPPMAIFFPIFTLLEDFGYLPRVAFNLDRIFKKSGAHGKQALTMSMGFGCNAAGVVATRIINSPREKLIAIITNNFSLCNGRWPTQILIATIFIGVLVPKEWSTTVSMLAVIGIALLGVFFTFGSSWLLSKTVLKGETSFFTLELPPYRPPRFWQTIYTSLIDRTLIVLWRAIVFAAPAGAVIWLISNVFIGDMSIAAWTIDFLNPVGLFLGLNGVILLAYIVAIPANEVVIPTILMLTTIALGDPSLGEGAGVLFEGSEAEIAQLLYAGGWTLLTGINLMLFSLLHNPCSTTIYTIYKETNSVKWTVVATMLPLIFGVLICALTAFLFG